MPKNSVLEHVRRLETKISSLTTLMQKGFVGVDRRFDQVTDDIGRMVRQGFDEIDIRFAQVDDRFNRMDERFDGVDNRLASMERQLHHAAYQNELVALEHRVDIIERHTGISKR